MGGRTFLGDNDVSVGPIDELLVELDLHRAELTSGQAEDGQDGGENNDDLNRYHRSDTDK